MKNNLKERDKKNKGITLIALVITIVVLLILAGVTIAMLTGENGILTQAQNAKSTTKKGEADEQRSLAQIEAKLNKNENGTEYKEDDGNGNTTTVKIPKGFVMTNVEGESTIEEGLVITDGDGNEYVWIPCTEEEYKNATDQKGNWKQYGYLDKEWNDETVADTISYEERLESVKNNGGFYVARYEAGIPEEATEIYANEDGGTYETETKKNNANVVESYAPTSRKNMQAWNFISQTNAKKAVKKMVSNEDAQSYLIDSYAWDIICKKYESLGTSLTDSRKYGNYYNNVTTNYEKLNTLYALHKLENGWQYATTYNKGQVTGAPKGNGTNRLELATGASDDFKIYNIYDMAGNMWEWTTETSTSNTAVLRGGSFYNVGSYFTVVYRGGDNGVGVTYVGFGFRAVLYLK